jgi:hypothetical protein
MQRCRAFKGWDQQQAKDNIRQHLKQFFADVKNTFIDDVLDMVIKRVGIASKETLDKARNGIAETLEETGNILDKFVKKPVAASVSNGAKAVKTGSSKSREVIEKLAKDVSRHGAKSFRYIKDKTNIAGKHIVAVTKKSSATAQKSLAYAKTKSSEIASKLRSKFKKPDDQL